MHGIHLTIVLAPLFAAIIAGLFGRQIGRAGSHWLTILAVGLSFALSILVLKHLYWDGGQIENYTVYTWAVSDGLHMNVGFLIDRLTALMTAVIRSPRRPCRKLRPKWPSVLHRPMTASMADRR